MTRAEPKFVENFTAARRALQLTTDQVGARMRARGMKGWTKRTVENLEHGSRSPRVHEAEALAEIVSVPLDRMFTESAAHVMVIARRNMHGDVA